MARRRLVDYIEGITPGMPLLKFETVDEKMAALRHCAQGHAFDIRRENGARDTVDAITAGVIVKVYDNLGEANRTKYGLMPIEEMAGVAWKMVEKGALVLKFEGS